MREINREQRKEIKERILFGNEDIRKILLEEYSDYGLALVIRTTSCKRGGPESHPFRKGPTFGPTRDDICGAYFSEGEAEKNCPKTSLSFQGRQSFRIEVGAFKWLKKEDPAARGCPFNLTAIEDKDLDFIFEELRRELIGYIENPKFKGSGKFACIPHLGKWAKCPVGCADCFYLLETSYLQPLEENLPNMPDPRLSEEHGYVVSVCDGNDSNHKRSWVIERTKIYKRRFYNTAIPKDIKVFGAPVVLTVNSAKMTDVDACFLDDIPKNLMFVRVRVNTWNLDLVDRVWSIIQRARCRSF